MARTTSELSLAPAPALPRLGLLWSPNRRPIKRVVTREAYDYIILDMDTPLAHVAQILTQDHPDQVFIPINPQELTLVHLPTVLEALSKLAETTGPASRVTLVPLGRPREDVLGALEAAPLKPPGCQVAGAVRYLPTESSLSVATGQLLWDFPDCEDLQQQFKDLATSVE